MSSFACSEFGSAAATALPFRAPRIRWADVEFGDEEDSRYCKAISLSGTAAAAALPFRARRIRWADVEFGDEAILEFGNAAAVRTFVLVERRRWVDVDEEEDFQYCDDVLELGRDTFVDEVLQRPRDERRPPSFAASSSSSIPAPSASSDWTHFSSSSSYRSHPYEHVERWRWGEASRRYAAPGPRNMGGYTPHHGTGKNQLENARKKVQKERKQKGWSC